MQLLMKKSILILLIYIPWGGHLLAQNDSLRVKVLSDSLTSLYERYFNIEKNTTQVQGKLSNDLKNFNDKIKKLENQTEGNSEQLAKMSDADRRTSQTIYENNRLSFLATANYMDGVNNSLNALEFSVSSLDYSNSIFELNNPTNTDLGFSLDKVVIKLMNEKVLTPKAEKKFGSKLRSIVTNILNNPLVNNPITKALVSTVPAVSSIVSVFDVVNSAAVSNVEIEAQSLLDFNKGLQKYVGHYEALAKASKDLEFNLGNLKLKAESVRKLASNFAKESVIDLYTRQNAPNMTSLDMNTIIKKHFNYPIVSEYIGQLEKSNNHNYPVLAKRVMFPLTGRSKISFIGEELEKLYNEYLATLSNYHNSIIVILNNANGLSEDQSKIAQKIYDLDKRYKALIESYEKNVNIENLRSLESNVPRY
jgi:hypothetical protein